MKETGSKRHLSSTGLCGLGMVMGQVWYSIAKPVLQKSLAGLIFGPGLDLIMKKPNAWPDPIVWTRERERESTPLIIHDFLVSH